MFCLILDPSAGPTEREDEAIARSLDPLGRADRIVRWSDEHCHVVRAITENTDASRAEAAVAASPANDRVCVAWAHLGDRANLRRALAADLPSRDGGREVTDPMLVMAAYDRWGAECVDRLVGAFVFAVWDAAERELFVARDPLGQRPLAWCRDGERLVLSTTIATMPAAVATEPNDGWLARRIVGVSASHTDTAWRGVAKLPGGHRMRVRLDAAPRIDRYHRFRDDAPNRSRRDDAWVHAYRETLERVMVDQVETAHPLGFETSGGIDSGTCISFGARAWTRSREELHTFGFVQAPMELDFISVAGEAAGITNQHIGRHDEFDRPDRNRRFEILGQPDEHGIGSAHQPFYDLAHALGVRTLHSGFGGDEAVTHHAYQVQGEFVSARRWALLARTALGPPHRVPFQLRTIVRRERAAMAEAAWPDALAHRRSTSVLRPDAFVDHGVDDALVASFDSPDTHTVNEHALDQRLGKAYVPTRLETCAVLAAAHGVGYRWPLLDVRLIQQWLSTPSIEKFGPGIGRYLHRRAIDGIVPDTVAWKPTKHMGVTYNDEFIDSRHIARPRSDYHERVEALIDRPTLDRLVSTTDDRSPLARSLGRQIRRLDELSEWLDDLDRS